MNKFNNDKWNFPEDGIEWLGEDVNKMMLKEINEIANKLNIRYKKYIYVVNKLINFVI